MANQPPRVRFAPSPTGFLHVGGARTALFNWLYARRNGGVFILRIEDTDHDRSSSDMVKGILEGLQWLGLDWDEGPNIDGPHGPYFQSQRLTKYRLAVEKLVSTGLAYYCYCLPDELKRKREAAQASGGAWRYDRTCLDLPPEAIAAHETKKTPRAVRFKVPRGRTSFKDVVRGMIDIDNQTLEDFVLMRSDGSPTYHLSVVVDDIDMVITDVVRGDDHTSNTPKQVLLYKALDADLPRFAHVPLIFGSDKKRLSKRHGATSVSDFQVRGYLPDAMVNFLSLLGWSPGNDQEVFTRGALVQTFSLEGINSGKAIFDYDKLAWLNGQHIGLMSAEAIINHIESFLKKAGVWHDSYATAGNKRAWLGCVVDLLKARARYLEDFVEYGQPFFVDTVTYDPEAVTKRLSVPGLGEYVAALKNAYTQLDQFDSDSLERTLRDVAEAQNIKAGILMHATRVAVSGRMVGPGLFEMIELIGRERTCERLDELQKFLAD